MDRSIRRDKMAKSTKGKSPDKASPWLKSKDSKPHKPTAMKGNKKK